MSGCSSTSSSSRNAAAVKAIANFAVFLNGSPRSRARRRPAAPSRHRSRSSFAPRRRRSPCMGRNLGPPARRVRRSAGSPCRPPRPAVTPSSATAAPSAADASATPRQGRSRRKDDRARRQRQRVQHHAERPRIRRSGHERRRRAHRDRQALLRGPRRDWDLHVLVVDAATRGSARARRRRRRGDPDWARRRHGHRARGRPGASPPADRCRPDRSSAFPRSTRTSGPVRIALRRVDAVDDAARRRDVEVDVRARATGRTRAPARLRRRSAASSAAARRGQGSRIMRRPSPSRPR